MTCRRKDLPKAKSKFPTQQIEPFFHGLFPLRGFSNHQDRMAPGMPESGVGIIGALGTDKLSSSGIPLIHGMGWLALTLS
jgi:hypothetical protein